uniref:NADH-ubiquinone oxidoreductase chain 4L n=1 Tax=Saccopharynx lavenbergi TaxID=136490 RepID=Q76MG7_9TELE|nr:NADH dehydrogenase subunits 4L [Saccopharynx lavenbergi]
MSSHQFSLSLSFALALLGFMYNQKHLLLALLCLEAMMLTLYILMAIWPSQTEHINPSPLPILMLAFSACEAGAGLALLVSISRTHTTEHLENMTILQC